MWLDRFRDSTAKEFHIWSNPQSEIFGPTIHISTLGILVQIQS